MNLKLKQIEISDLQARATTDQVTVAEYAEAWKEGEKFPPIIVFHDGKDYFLADGFHRYFGALKAELLDINVDIRKGSRKDALWFAVSANRAHGLKRTPADKRRSVELALREKPELADNAIAKYIGVSWDLVKSVRGLLPVPEVEKRIGLDGKKRTAPVPVAPKVPTAPPPPRSLPPKPPEPPKPVLDKTGLEIPPEILTLWQQAETEVTEDLADISRMKAKYEKLQDGKNKLYARACVQAVFADLSKSYSNLKCVVPYAVCATCQGQIPDNCKACDSRGFVGKHYWETCVTAEEKAMRAKHLKK